VSDSTLPAALTRPGKSLPSRHIHLDFHTSPAVIDVGRDFDADEFAETLERAGIKSITVFAKCHHGMAYYPTEVGQTHPGLSRDLLGEQIAACHRRGIQVAAYISVMYDQRVWNAEGGSRVLARDGSPVGLRATAGPVSGELGKLCLNTPYLDYVTAMATEVLQKYDVDGLFFDNVQYGGHIGDGAICFCVQCVADRRELGIAPDDRQGHLTHMENMIDGALARMFGAVAAVRPDVSTFVNGQLVMGAPASYLRRIAPRYRHLEIESLPGGDWGYTHFPIAVRAMRKFGLDMMGMTGAFHRSWGDFGSVRTQEATDYECEMMLAQGAKVAVGDHLHPYGVLNKTAYERIGNTFRGAAAKEPWTADAVPVTEIGVLISPETIYSPAVLGASKMLTQLRHQFDLVDNEADFSAYRLLILPDNHTVSADLARTLEKFIAAGGAVLASGQSVPAAVDGPYLGIDRTDPWDHQDQYLRTTSDLEGFAPDVHIAYRSGPVPTASAESVVLAHYWRPFFDNSYEHFQVEQVPPAGQSAAAAIVATDSSVYVGPPVFGDYATHAYPPHRDLVSACIKRLLPDPVVTVEGPSTLQATVTAQPGRTVVHLLHYVPEMRAPGVEIVEDAFPLHDLAVRIRAEDRPAAVYLAPQQEPLDFVYLEGYVHTVLPRLAGHQMLVVEADR